MLIFIYTFVVVFVALVIILGIGSMLTGIGVDRAPEPEGKATAAMCTTQLLGRHASGSLYDNSCCDEDFVIEQDLVFTFDSINL